MTGPVCTRERGDESQDFLFRDSLQLRPGLVDLVVCVRGHRRGGHRPTLASARFVGLVGEDTTYVSDRGGDFQERP